jgi:VWFA-related protein
MRILGILPTIWLGVVAALGAEAPEGSDAARIVNLNVIALDSQGQPVAGLSAEDFQVLDNGKPRRVVWAHALGQKRPAATFILFDLLNSDFAARGLSATEITRALEKPGFGDNVYLYVLTPSERIVPVHGVSPEEAANAASPTRQVKPALDEVLRQVNGLKTQDDRLPPLRIEPTWKAMTALIAEMAEVPGPKSFVWITQGVLNGFFDYGNRWFKDTTPLRIFAGNLSAIDALAYSVEQRPNGSLASVSDGSSGDTLKQISELTGGHALPSDNVEQAIRQAVNDAAHMNYRIAFESEKSDGKYHKLRVTTTRRDIRIQTADHYYAFAGPGPDAEQRAEGMEESISRSPFDFDAIAVSGKATPMADTPGQVHLTLRVNAADVELIREGGRYRGSLAIALAGAGPAGIVGAAPADLDLSAEDYAKASKEGIEIARVARVEAAAKQVRIMVLDRNSFLAGTATVPLNGR